MGYPIVLHAIKELKQLSKERKEYVCG
jgi:hypothetical protein